MKRRNNSLCLSEATGTEKYSYVVLNDRDGECALTLVTIFPNCVHFWLRYDRCDSKGLNK